MDVYIYTKESVLQPSGNTEVYVDGIFDFHLIEEGSIITGAETVEDTAELKQQAVFAALKQKGSDPLASSEGVQWAEALLGEISSTLLMYQIKNAVTGVSGRCSVIFTTTDSGTLGFYIEVAV